MKRIIGLVVLCPILSLSQHESAQALACGSYDIVYARGSGQIVNAMSGEDGYEHERDTLRSLIDYANVNFIELDEQMMGLGGSYPAAKVSEESLAIGLKAKINKATIGKYAVSVWEGANLLKQYIDTQSLLTPDKCFILTGYSQGAHVIGNYLQDNQYNDEILSKIKYVGLIGDPKLNLYGVSSVPGENIPWYRGNAIAAVQHGFLDQRVPYMPLSYQSLKIPTGSWCYFDDIICASNYIQHNGHGSYVERGAIAAMSYEIQDVINTTGASASTQKFPSSAGCGAPRQDLVVMLDTSPIMRRNSDLFTDAPNSFDLRKAPGSTTYLPYRTTGQILMDSGCGDTRLAVVGYGRAQDGPPELLMDFTSSPADFDALMKSLYESSDTGTYEQTQYREAASVAMDVAWRDDAQKTVVALTNLPGRSPVPTRWPNNFGVDNFFSDTLGKHLIAVSRDKDIALLGIPIPLSYTGYTPASGYQYPGDVQNFMFEISKATGGYNWLKYYGQPSFTTFKAFRVDQTIRSANQLRHASYASAQPVRIRAGESINLSTIDPLNLLSSAKLRGDNVYYKWSTDCGSVTSGVTVASYVYNPLSPQKCKAAVRVYAQRNGNGCYSSCPEPFPPYFNRTLSFDLEVLPSDYVDKIPSPMTRITKTIKDDSVEYDWDAPSYIGDKDLVYVLRDSDNAVLGATTARQAVVTETDGDDPEIYIQAAGEDGMNQLVSSKDPNIVEVVDERTPPAGEVLGEQFEQDKYTDDQPTHSNTPYSYAPLAEETSSTNSGDKTSDALLASISSGLGYEITTNIDNQTTGRVQSANDQVATSADQITEATSAVSQTDQALSRAVQLSVGVLGLLLLLFIYRKTRQSSDTNKRTVI